MKLFRIIKIHGKFRRRAWDHTTVPVIRMEGKWLENLGFKVGDEITIRAQKNKLTIINSKVKPKIKG